MSNPLTDYYRRELRFVRELVGEFANLHKGTPDQPGAAQRLLLLPDGRSTDPHVELLVQAFAYLTANVRVKLDDDFPELTDALLGVLYPHYLAPVPSMMVVRFRPPGGATQDFVPRGSRMQTAPVDGVRCDYRTCYDTPVWPITVKEAAVRLPPFGREYASAPPGTKAMLRLRLDFPNTPIETISSGPVRFYIPGDPQVSAELYELLFTAVKQVVIQSPGNRKPAGSDVPYQPTAFNKPADIARAVRPVGFGPGDAILPYPGQSFPGYRLLTELFTFPEKFRFFDLDGWDDARGNGLVGTQAEFVFYLSRTTPVIDTLGPQHFVPNCTPAVNLLTMTTESVPLTRLAFDYRVVPDANEPRAYEIYSIDDVYAIDSDTGDVLEYRPFYSYRHGHSDNGRAFWHASRRPAEDDATDVFLNLVDLKFDAAALPANAADHLVNVKATCTNRNLPEKLIAAAGSLQMSLEGAVCDVEVVRPPTPPLRPPLRKNAYWRLASHLNLNHLSLSDAAEGRDTLRRYLELYDFSDPTSQVQQAIGKLARQMREGVDRVKSVTAVDFIGGGDVAGGFARGIEIHLDLLAENYPEVGAYLFAAVMDRFFGLYTSINSFTRLVAQTPATEKPWTFPARCGDKPLI